MYCFRQDWRFGLYFDYSPSVADSRSDADLAESIGDAYRHLIFFDDYAAYQLGSENGLMTDGWFPFIELLGREFTELVDAYCDKDQRSELLEFFMKRFSKDRIEEFTAAWWDDEVMNSKKDIIMAGIEGYLSGTQSGNIVALKTLYSEIEGVIRIKYCKENKTGYAKFSDLFNYIEMKGSEKFQTASLAFPETFYRYVRQHVFANFDIQAADVPMSRNSARTVWPVQMNTQGQKRSRQYLR